MLIELSVGNFLSFDEVQTLSMVATSDKSLQNKAVVNKPIKTLRLSAIYGLNASGKSNLLIAMSTMRNIILRGKSSLVSPDDNIIEVIPFRLKEESKNKASHFEVVFYINNDRYRYGFEVKDNTIEMEWLYITLENKNRESYVFEREFNEFRISNKFKKIEKYANKTLNEEVFLSKLSIIGEDLFKNIIENFFKNITVISAENIEKLSLMSISMYPKLKNTFKDVLLYSDLGINDISLEQEKKISIDGKQEVDIEFKTIHKIFNEENKTIGEEKFDFFKTASWGTKQIFALMGPIIESLTKNKILFIDEFSAKLHPLLAESIINLFMNYNTKNDNKYSNSNAQMIVVDHNTNLLKKELFRRDQVWFTEKNKYGRTELYSLAEFKTNKGKVRKDASYEKNYLEGRYGAIPYLDDFENIFFNKE